MTPATRAVAAAIEHRPDVAVLDLNSAVCGEGYRSQINGAELYADRVHFSRQGSELVWTWLAPEIVTAWGFRDA